MGWLAFVFALLSGAAITAQAGSASHAVRPALRILKRT
jgi:hypothetical protein